MSFLFLMAALVGVGSVALFGIYMGRRLLRRMHERRLEAQAYRVSNLLGSARKEHYKGLDKMLFDMRDNYDMGVIEEQLREHLDTSEGETAQHIIHGFSLIGLTERYIERVKKATSWHDRSKAARVLGEIGDPQAVPALLDVMRAPREDNDVKLACAEALGRIQDPSVVPILCEELGKLDEWSSPRIAAVLVAFGKSAVEPLMALLDSGATLNGRVWAAQVLGKIKTAKAVPQLINRLHDRSEQMRLSAANALGDIGDLRAVRPLVDVILRDPTAAVRAQGASALGRLGDPDVIPILVASLGDPEYWMRFRALEAIEVLNPKDTSPIESALDDATPEVRRRAALALERLGKLEQAFTSLSSSDPLEVTTAVNRLIAVGRAGLSERFIRHLDDENPILRGHIATILGKVGAVPHGKEVVKLIRDDELPVRLAAIHALSDLGTPGTGESLIELFVDDRSDVRDSAAKALALYPQAQLQQLLPQLTDTLDHESDATRLCATIVLANTNGKDIDELLLTRALHDRFVEVRILAVQALGQRHMSEAVESIGGCLRDTHNPMRIAASIALGEIGGERAMSLLLAAMNHADRQQRDVLCRSIATLGFIAIGPAMDVLLGSPDLNARLGAVWTLGKISDQRAVPLLIELIRDSQPKVRSSAAGALGKIPGPQSIAALSSAMRDPNQYVRAAVINALGKIGGTQQLDLLRNGLGDPDPFVRQRAVVAIGQIGGHDGFELISGVATETLDDAHRIIALVLCGVPEAIGAAVGLLQNRTTREHTSKLLKDEEESLQERFLTSIRLETAGRLNLSEFEFFAHLDPDSLAQRFIDTLRNDQDSLERKRAVAALANLETPMAVEALAASLRHDPDRQVRLRVASCLTQQRDNAHVRFVLGQAVVDPYPEVRIAAISSLGNVGDIEDAQPLLRSLRANEPQVVAASETALAKIFGQNVVDFIDWMLGQLSPKVFLSSLRIVTEIADDRSLGLLLHLLGSSVAEIRLQTVSALARLRHPDAIQRLLEALSDPIQDIRAQIVTALCAFPRNDVFDEFRNTILDPSVLVRSALATGLPTMENTQAVELLDTLTQDQHPDVITLAMLGLLDCPDNEGKSRFLDRWPNLSETNQNTILHQQSGQADKLAAFVTSASNPKLREVCVRCLAALGPRRHARHIALGLRDPHPDVRIAAIEGLSCLAKERLEDWLKSVMDDPVAEVRAAARRLLIHSV